MCVCCVKRRYRSRWGNHVLDGGPDPTGKGNFGSQAYGFEETDNGTLQPQEPLPRDATIGPAFYSPALVCDGGASSAESIVRPIVTVA